MDRATSDGNEAKSMMKHNLDVPTRAEIQTQVVVICDPTRYRLDRGGAKNKL